MMKKICSLVLTVCFVAGVLSLSGCGKKPTDVTEDGKTIVKIWTGEGSSKKKMEELISRFNQTIGEEQKIVIEYTVHGGENVIDNALDNGNAPDLFALGGDGYSYVRKKYIMALEDLDGGADILKRYEGRLVKDREIIDGKTYKLPFKSTVYGIAYNKELFKKAGIVDAAGEPTPPKTYDEWIAYSKRISSLGDDIFGTIIPLKWSGFFSTEVIAPSQGSFGYTTFSTDKQAFDYTHFKPIFEKYLELKASGSVFPGAEGLDNDAARAQFAQGNIGMKMAASWDVGVLNEQFGAEFDWGVAPCPVLNENEKYKQAVSVATFVYINAKIPKEKQKKVALVYDWLYSDEVAIELYESGLYIPPNEELIQRADLTDAPKQWKEFGEIVSISDATAKPILTFDVSRYYEYEGTSMTTIYQQIWDGVLSVDDGLSYIEQYANEALDRALEQSGTDRKSLGYKANSYQ